MREQIVSIGKNTRQFRKDLLDKKELELEVEISNGMNDPKNVKLSAMTERGLMKTLKKLKKCMDPSENH